MPASKQASRTKTKSQLARIIAHAGGASATPEAHETLADGALRVGAYCRYSSHNQDDSYSLEAQHEAVDREAAALGNWQVRYYDEPATSAYTEHLAKRPVFLRMLADAANGTLDIVVVHRLDRFSRNLSIQAQTIPALLAVGVQFLSLTERVDASNPMGQFVLNVMGSQAEFTSTYMGVRIRDGQRQRAKTGLHNSRVPYGYRATGDKTPAEPDTPPDDANTRNPAYSWNGLMRFVRLALSGLPDYAIADTLNAEGYRLTTPSGGGEEPAEGRLFSRVTVSILRRNVYYRPFTPGDDRGTISYAGVESRGQHQAAMGWDEWQQLQGMARNRRWGWNTPGLQRHYAATSVPFTAEFRGLAVCSECGSRLYVWRNIHNLQQKSGMRRIYERYVCSAHKRATVCARDGEFARVEDVRMLWLHWIRDHLTPPPDWEALIIERLRERQEGEQKALRLPARELRMEHLRWTEKRNRAIEVYTEGLKDRAWMEVRVAEADAALLALDRAERPQEMEHARMVDAAHFLMDLPAMWEQGTTEQRIVLASHVIAPGGLHLELRSVQSRGNRWHPYEPGVSGPPSCAITRVELQPAFRDLWLAIRHMSGVA